jgi:hypothetical protein
METKPKFELSQEVKFECENKQYTGRIIKVF